MYAININRNNSHKQFNIFTGFDCKEILRPKNLKSTSLGLQCILFLSSCICQFYQWQPQNLLFTRLEHLFLFYKHFLGFLTCHDRGSMLWNAQWHSVWRRQIHQLYLFLGTDTQVITIWKRWDHMFRIIWLLPDPSNSNKTYLSRMSWILLLLSLIDSSIVQ